MTFSFATSAWFAMFLNVCLQSSILLVLAILGLQFAKNSSAARRHQIAAIAFVALLLLPFLSWALPLTWQIPGSSHAFALPAMTAKNTLSTPALPAGSKRSQTEDNPDVQHASQASRMELPHIQPPTAMALPAPYPWTSVLLLALFILWFTLSVLLLLRQAIALIQLGLLAQHRKEDVPRDLCERIARLTGVGRDVSRFRLILDEVPRNTTPVTWGAVRPVLLLPHDIRGWTDSQLRPVLLHEMEHIWRGDWLVQTITQFSCAVYWFHPLAWYLFHRMRVEAEVACDDAVIRAGIPGAEYAERLIEIVALLKSRRAFPAAIGIFRRSQVTGRIRSILAGGRNRERATIKSFGALAVTFAVLLLGTAGLRPMSAQQKGQRMDASHTKSPLGAPRPEGPSGRIVPLDNGIQVELVAVGASPLGSGSKWWTPDGAILLDSPVMNNNRFHTSYTGAGEQYLRRSLFFRLRSNADGDASTTGYVVDASRHLDTDGYHHGRDMRLNDTHLLKQMPATGWVLVSLPKSETRITYRFGIATGPWETIAVTRPVLHPAPGDIPGTAGGDRYELNISLDSKPQIAYRDARGNIQTQSLLGNHAPLEDVARRLLAFDSGGHEVSLDEGGGDYQGDGGVRITGRQLARIAEFRLQTRPYQWAEFPDIALQPKSGITHPAPTPSVLAGYSHRFACGMTVEIPGVTERRTDGGRWWRPDGKQVPGPMKEFENVVSFQSWEAFRHPTAVLLRQTSKRNVLFSQALQVLPETRVWKGVRHISRESFIQGGHPFVGAFNIDQPGDTNDMTLRFGVGSGAWKTVAVIPMPADIQHSAITPNFSTGAGTNGDIYLTLSDHPEMTYRSRSGQAQRQTFLRAGGSLGSVARQIVAIDKSGKQIAVNGTYEGGPDGEAIALSFQDSGSLRNYNPFDLADIKEFRLQTRPYEWAEFRHICLHPTR